MADDEPHRHVALAPWRARLHEVIFEADTPAGKLFDVALLVAILASVFVVMLESVTEIRAEHGELLRGLEWGFTLLFSLEYVLRLLSVARPMRYAYSFYGIIDLLSIVPTYLSVFVAGTQSLIVIRALRLLRVFRVLKLAHFLGEAATLSAALRAARFKIIVFLFAVVTMIMILGTIMYLIEGEDSGFTSIPQSIYWAIVTMTTVGYGDIAPQTIAGKIVASIAMILGYSVLAVPTGIVTVELASAHRDSVSAQSCRSCGAEGHRTDATFCFACGTPL